MGKRVLVVGSGGREHAIVKSFSNSPKVEKIYCAPGNAGISEQAECINIKVTDVEALVNFAQRNHIDLVVIGPEAALDAGLADALLKADIKVFGPSRSAARVESSKEYAKKLMKKYHVPTAEYSSFNNFGEALEYIKNKPMPIVIKYDGLAAGKGVIIAQTQNEAKEALKEILQNKIFGDGNVIIEDFLEGPEFSFMCFVNGEKVYPLEIAQDHKRAFDGDKGPNTGGMGAYSPVPFITVEIREKALNEIMKPMASALVKENNSFCGVLYGGLILTKDGPKVIEFNARFGDPETEVVLPRLESDLYEFIEAVLKGDEFLPEWSKDAVLGVVLASQGYPGSYEKGKIIKGLDKLSGDVFHMGTVKNKDEYKTDGGRVLMVTGRGDDLAEANLNAISEIALIECDSLFHRTDIGKAVLNN